MRAARLHAVGDLRAGLGEVAGAFGDAAWRSGLRVIVEPQR